MSAREWFSPQELADMRLPGMPSTDRGWRKQVQKNLTATRTKERGKGIEIHIASLPAKVQAAINVHLAIEKAKEHTGENHGNHEGRAYHEGRSAGGEPEAQRGREVGAAGDVAGVLGSGVRQLAAGSALCQPAGRSGLGEVAPSVSVAASGGEPIQAGLPSPVSCPAATVAGGLTGTGGSVVALSPPAAGGLPALSAPSAVSDAAGAGLFAAGVKAGMVLMSTEDRKAMEKRVKVAERRLNIVKPIIDWEEGKPGKSAFVIAQAKSHGETRATLYRWVKQFRHGGFDALMDKPRADKNAARVLVSAPWEIQARGCGIGKAKMAEIAEEITLVIRGLWAQQGMSSARQVALLAYPVLHKLSVDAGMPDFVAKKACKTISKRLIEGERRYTTVATFDRDGKAFYDGHIPSINRRRGDLKPGDMVFGDVSPCDIPVERSDGTIGWARLIAWQDCATNMLHMTGFLANKGSSVRREHVALAFAAMCEEAPWGMPKRLYLDNGSEYCWTEMLDAWKELAMLSEGSFGGVWDTCVLGEVGRVIRSIPFKPRAKSLEGQFSNLLRFMSWHTSFAGSDRMRKKVASLGKGVEGTTLPDLKKLLGESLAFYHGVPQGGHLDGRSPAEKMDEFLQAGYRRTTINAEALAFAFSDRLERKVRTAQVEAGGLHYYHPDLHMYDGEKVLVRHARHAPDAAYVFRKGQLLCVATPMPIFDFADPLGAKQAGRLAAEARHAVRVMKGQVAWLDPRDLMGEFAKLAGVSEVIDRAEHGQRVIELTPEAKAISDARKEQMLQTIESAANQKVVILDRRFDQSIDADAEAARALGF